MTPVPGEPRVVPTFCRICEPACGLVAEVRDGRLVDVRPDRDHPVSRGYACHKGLAALDVHHDEGRLNHPMRRQADGSWTRASWADATAAIAGGLRSVLDRYGPNAIGAFMGNPQGFNTTAGMAFGALFGQLGVTRFFSSSTQDCANKFAASEAVYGSRRVHPIPDVQRARFVMLIGANPKASQGSFLSVPNFAQKVREVRQRGGRAVFVNPRRVDEDTVLIRPDTDVYFLAALLEALDRIGAWKADLAEQANHVDELRSFVRRYPAERTAAVTGVEAQTVHALAREIADTDGVAFYGSTGINMGRQGTLAYWLVQMLSYVTGNLDRLGGSVLSLGYYRNAPSGRTVFERAFVETEFGRVHTGELPGNLLSHYVLDVDEPLRALIVVAGNPLLSIGGEDRLRKAFEQLELVVVVDIYGNATAAYGHWLLPATDMFERPDLTVNALSFQDEPYVQYTDAVVEPQHERREEWWIAAQLALELGLDSPLGEGRAGSDELWRKYEHMLSQSGLSRDELRSRPSGTALLPPLRAGVLFDEVIQTPDRRIECCPPEFAEAIERCEQLFAELSSEPAGTLKLITRRDRWMHNSWLHNLPRMHRGGRDNMYAYVHPVDAESRGLRDGDMARLASEWGAIETLVRIDDEMMVGTVAVPHGFGHAGAPTMTHAAEIGGANINRLLPVGPDSYEPLSSQSFMTGIRVELAALAPTS